METIFAISSGSPPAAIAVMRISGPHAVAAAEMLGRRLPPPRQAALRALRDPASGDLLDRALVLWFAGPATATGEDLVELHLHGGRAIVAAVAQALSQMPGLRPALPGEFTRRALMAGRIDLAEAEGLGDLLMAETEAQRRRAIAAVEGLISQAVGRWSDRLLRVSAEVEALLDFSDEDDVSGAHGGADIASAITALAGDIGAVLAVPPVERLRDGLRVILAGPPNSGKSSLINILAARQAAIVSPVAGTTRDRIEAPVIRDGIAYILTDTAGLAQRTDDPIEAIGIALAEQAVASADIVLWLGDAAPPPHVAAIWLYPRADDRPAKDDLRRLSVSAVTQEGIAALWDAIRDTARRLLPRDDQMAVNQRQRALLTDCVSELHLAVATTDLLLVAEHLRLARRALDSITGVTHVEEMLDALFGQFCIGK
jgi:tRNA modification GTPase